MIVIPAAGEGRRFKEAGYTQPKHLIPLGGTTMIELVVANIRPLEPKGEVLVLTQYEVGKTRGTAETIAKAADRISEDESLVIANCDQLVEIDDAASADCDALGDGMILTFHSANPAHSYVLTAPDGLIARIREKEVISSRAVSGVYWFPRAGWIVDACKHVTEHGEGELYLSGAFRRMLDQGARLYAVDAPTAILGTPEDFARFEVALSMARAA